MKDSGEFLTLGTVVLLKGATKKLMITGYCAYDKENEGKMYTYSGCLYPEGIISSNEMALFNHNQIEKVFFNGYTDEEDKEFKAKLVEILKQIQTNQN